MISEPSSTLASDYQQPVLLMKHGPTTAFDPDQDSSQPEFHPVLFPGAIASESPSALTDDSIRSTSPESLFMAELAGKARQVREVYQAYRSRIEALRSDAVLDGFALNKASETDFWSFVTSVPFVRKAEVVLVDNGNLRAVWGGEDGSHLGLQFLGERTLQYVIFRRRTGSRHISRVAGSDTFEGVKRQVRIFELEALLQA
jgi:hypothetical protein